jgi:hypothetical protein
MTVKGGARGDKEPHCGSSKDMKIEALIQWANCANAQGFRQFALYGGWWTKDPVYVQ